MTRLCPAAYSSGTNNDNNPRIIPEDVDKDLSLHIESEFDNAIENLNLTDEEKAELDNNIGDYSNKSTIELEDIFYLNNARLGVKNEKKNYVHDDLRELSIPVQETASLVGSDIRNAEGATESTAAARGESATMVRGENESNQRGNAERGTDVQGQPSSTRKSGNTNNDKLLLQEGRRIAEEIRSKNVGAELSSRQRGLLAAQYAISRELVFRDARLAAIKENIGLEEGKPTSLDEIAAIFEKYNKDKEVKALFEKILSINKRLGTSIQILSSDENGNYGSSGL